MLYARGEDISMFFLLLNVRLGENECSIGRQITRLAGLNHWRQML
jgi:hypothetical protein